MMTFAVRYCTRELQLQFFGVYMYYCAFKPICGLGLGLASYGLGLGLVALVLVLVLVLSCEVGLVPITDCMSLTSKYQSSYQHHNCKVCALYV